MNQLTPKTSLTQVSVMVRQWTLRYSQTSHFASTEKSNVAEQATAHQSHFDNHSTPAQTNIRYSLASHVSGCSTSSTPLPRAMQCTRQTRLEVVESTDHRLHQDIGVDARQIRLRSFTTSCSRFTPLVPFRLALLLCLLC